MCTYETIPICCVHGDEKPYPTADIFIEVQGQPYLLNVGVADNLPFPVVLGEDLPVLYDLLKPAKDYNVAITRTKAKEVNEHLPTLSTLPFFEADLETKPGRSKKSRSQRKLEKFRGTVVKLPDEATPDEPLGFQMPINIIQVQQNNPALSAIFLRAKQKDSEGELGNNKEGYFSQNGILYHRCGQAKRLVVLQEARDVLNLGHSIPWAGHLGKHKTTSRIKRYFHWPGLCSDVAKFCKSCPQCQKTSIKSPSRVPLQPMPVIGTPFERLGMDIVGPLEKSHTGYRYMLVVTDYATKYPEVFPLKTIKAKAVAFSFNSYFQEWGFLVKFSQIKELILCLFY
ncbi:protein NYNRIN-like [Girardinichthys multiradiatus]|uniref:protein NYNRIN-like n=1 Tax=Girardinichthys multiradiatus TaxID=208333 RepID=UPI001FADA974|nr:protein NYNRIN-like [Girardinichthys multiradiatus]